MRRLALALVLLILWVAPVGADEKVKGVKPLTRSPHMFEEPQAKYPPLGAIEAFRGGLPLALGIALASLALATWLTRPLPEVELALEQREARLPGPVAWPTGPVPTPQRTAPAVEGPPSGGPAAPPTAPVNVPQVLRSAAPEAPEPAVLRLVPAPVRRTAEPRVPPPAESPLRPLDWQEVAPDRPLPFRDRQSTLPGLVVYLADPPRVPALLALLTADLLLDLPGRVVLASVSAGPADVVEALLETGPETPRTEVLARVRQEGKALDRLARRLLVPTGEGLTVEGLLRRARDLAEGRGGLAGVVLDSATRLEMGRSHLVPWLRSLHEVGCHGEFPVFLVAPRPGFPALQCPGRVVDLDDMETARLLARSPGTRPVD